MGWVHHWYLHDVEAVFTCRCWPHSRGQRYPYCMPSLFFRFLVATVMSELEVAGDNANKIFDATKP